MARQTLNEERGARDAAKLKQRFRKVSSRSIIGGSSRLLTGGAFDRKGVSKGTPGGRSGRTSLGFGKAVVVWLMIGLVAFLIGSFVR